MFFHLRPEKAILSDVNPRLIETYLAIKDNWRLVWSELERLQIRHCKQFYYEERSRRRRTKHTRAAQFLYLNRTCWNGLYRENLKGQFNVPIGSKTQVLMPDDNFQEASQILSKAQISTCDFEDTLHEAKAGDLVFLDPPYTTAHNTNGFIKYNQNIFSWGDQVRLQRCARAARDRGARIVLTNANHESILDLYSEMGAPMITNRSTVISGSNASRGVTSEALYIF